jgi:hypothetical protein
MAIDVDFAGLSVQQLLRLSRDAVTELRRRGIVRTANLAVGDYAEWLVAKTVNGNLVSNSTKSHDILTPSNERLQVKCRVVTDIRRRSERQLSAFRSWDCEAVVIVLFDESFNVRRMTQLPMRVVRAVARSHAYVNGHIVFATDELLSRPEAVQLPYAN